VKKGAGPARPASSGEEAPEPSADKAHLVWEDEGGSLVNSPYTKDDDGSSRPQSIVVDADLDLPFERADLATRPLGRFLKIEAAACVALLVATRASLVLSNSGWSAAFLSAWKIPVGFHFGSFDFSRSLQHMLNDGSALCLEKFRADPEKFTGRAKVESSASIPLAAAGSELHVPTAPGNPRKASRGVPEVCDGTRSLQARSCATLRAAARGQAPWLRTEPTSRLAPQTSHNSRSTSHA
jgi:hypothetical protein